MTRKMRRIVKRLEHIARIRRKLKNRLKELMLEQFWAKVRIEVRGDWMDVIIPKEWNGADIMTIFPIYMGERQ